MCCMESSCEIIGLPARELTRAANHADSPPRNGADGRSQIDTVKEPPRPWQIAGM